MNGLWATQGAEKIRDDQRQIDGVVFLRLPGESQQILDYRLAPVKNGLDKPLVYTRPAPRSGPREFNDRDLIITAGAKTRCRDRHAPPTSRRQKAGGSL